MTEHEGVPVGTFAGSDVGLVTLNSWNASPPREVLKSPDLWQPPDAYGGTKLISGIVANFEGFATLNEHSAIPPAALTAERYGFAVFPKHLGVPRQLIACYREVDRLALLAFVRRVDGVPIPDADILFKGNVYKEIGRTNRYGIVGAYLLPDTYSKTIVISPNGIVYEQVELKEAGKGVYEITVRRKTKANATFRTLHRRFD